MTTTAAAANSTFMIQPPEPFSFSSLNEWPKWKQCVQRFRNASGHGSKPEEHQIDDMFYVMGDQAEDIFSTFQLTTKLSAKLNSVPI